MSTLRIAWRNLLRNRRRTLITLTAVALTTAFLIWTLTLMKGMSRQMTRSATRLVTGDAQVHAEGYRKDRSFYSAIPKPDQALALAKAAGVLAAPRSYGFGLISSGNKSAGASYWGVDPKAERAAFELADEVWKGRYLGDEPKPEVVVGRKLAKSLNAEVGSELVAVVQAADGSLGNELFTVVGVLKTVGDEIDRGAVILHAQVFDELFVAGGRVHQIALNGQGKPPTEVVAALADLGEAVEVKTWRELMPMLSQMDQMMDAAIWLFMMIFFLAAGLGVLNTMLMAPHDRVREFGVLKALGATPWRIVRDVAAEGFVLAFVASMIGLVLGGAASVHSQEVGIDLTMFGDASFTFSGIAWDTTWRAYIEAKDIVAALVVMWLICILASLYPAIKAARLDPAQAMTHV